uniref:Distal membrane-arm assembly complex protein 1-like domain-containing protein n=1 Tax=Electrophorus electricus TaxID=8005 RepID=A0AAY5EXH9_ELEEL
TGGEWLQLLCQIKINTSVSFVSSIPSSTSGVAGMPLFGDCWSCRVLSGSGLIASAGYVWLAARKRMRQGGVTSMGTVAQLTFAAGLAAWGVVVMADPVGKATKKT